MGAAYVFILLFVMGKKSLFLAFLSQRSAAVKSLTIKCFRLTSHSAKFMLKFIVSASVAIRDVNRP